MRPTSSPATCPRWSFRAAGRSATTATQSASTTAPPTPRSASPPPASPRCSTGSSATPPERVEALRVAMLAPISWRVPPRHYGPWEQFVSLLTEGLVERGVDVTLFATADSITRARLIGTALTGYSEDPALDAKVWESLHIAALFERAAEFDVIHNSFD